MLGRIERLLTALDQRQPLDDDLSSWLHQGFIRHIKEGITLNAALNISGARDALLRKRRNQFLLRAWQAHQRIDPSMSNTQRSSELAALLNRFKAGRWERIKFDPVPPETLDEVHIWLFYALKTGVPILKERSIYNIVQNSGYSFFSENEIGCSHQNKIIESVMESKRVTEKQVAEIWAKRWRLTNSWRSSECQAQQAPAMAGSNSK